MEVANYRIRLSSGLIGCYKVRKCFIAKCNWRLSHNLVPWERDCYAGSVQKVWCVFVIVRQLFVAKCDWRYCNCHRYYAVWRLFVMKCDSLMCYKVRLTITKTPSHLTGYSSVLAEARRVAIAWCLLNLPEKENENKWTTVRRVRLSVSSCQRFCDDWALEYTVRAIPASTWHRREP